MYFLLFFLFAISSCYGQLNVQVRADSAILINADTGAILYEKDAYSKRYPASITKIATALYALNQKNDLSVMCVASREVIASISTQAREKANFQHPPHWIEIGGTHIGIKAGEELPYEALLYGMMLASGNDAANMIAEYVSGSTIPKFMEGLNVYLKEIGCKNTNFNSPHGHHHPNNYTTAYDMALITRRALQNPTFAKIVSTVTYKRPETSKQTGLTLVQGNKLLRKSSPYYYEKAIGVKTGNGSLAGDTFVAAARQDDRTLIAVLLHADQRKYNFEDAKKLFETAFKAPKMSKVLIKEGPQKYALSLPGAASKIFTETKKNFAIEYYQGEEPKLLAQLVWDSTNSLPIKKGTHLGNIQILNSANQLMTAIPLYAQKDVGYKFSHRLKMIFTGQGSFLDYLLLTLACLSLIFLRFYLASKDKQH